MAPFLTRAVRSPREGAPEPSMSPRTVPGALVSAGPGYLTITLKVVPFPLLGAAVVATFAGSLLSALALARLVALLGGTALGAAGSTLSEWMLRRPTTGTA